MAMGESQHLNAAQLSNVEKRLQAEFNSFIERMQLRKWSVEQAMSICSSLNKAVAGAVSAGETQGLVINDPMALAKAIYDFTAQPGVALKIDLTS
jgi:hypothetical protein